jgi:hypothetical protein
VNSAAGVLGGRAYFLHWGVVQISLANLVVIVLMVLIFALAVVLQFPPAHRRDDKTVDTDVRG